MNGSPIKYTSRDFWSIIADINSDAELVDKPDWFKRIFAGVGDELAMYEDAIANQSYLRTAFTTSAVRDLLKQIGYEMTAHTTSTGTLLFYISRTASFPVTFTQQDLVATTPGTVAVSAQRFEALIGQTVNAFSEVFSADAGTDKLTVARTNGYYLGDLVRVGNSGGALPGNLSANTDYYVIYVDATHIRLATTLTNAFLGTYIDISSTGSGTNTIYLYSFPATAQQQTTATNIYIGTSDGISTFQNMNIPYNYVLKNSITLSINSVTWTRIDDLINSLASDTVFRLLYQDNVYSYVEFGNNTYGAIPGNFDVYANFTYGGGVNSNVSTLNRINLYAGTNTNITGVTNTTTFSGGADPQAMADAKVLGPAQLKTRQVFVTPTDGQTLALNYGGLAKVKIDRNWYGVGTCRLLYIPTGGGVWSAGQKTAIKSYLEGVSMMQSATVTVSDPTYTSVAFTSSIKIANGYLFANVKPYYELCVRLIFSERISEFQSQLSASGIASLVTTINALWSYSFTSLDYSFIASIVEQITPVDFSSTINQSQIDGILFQVPGVSYFLISVPTFPLTLADGCVTTPGAITTTAI